jgi:hypothetical protein
MGPLAKFMDATLRNYRSLIGHLVGGFLDKFHCLVLDMSVGERDLSLPFLMIGVPIYSIKLRC